MATTAFIMEPCINPGLEAQAAARIHRLGQTKPTRVIRMLANNTVDTIVVEMQKLRKDMNANEKGILSHAYEHFVREDIGQTSHKKKEEAGGGEGSGTV